MKINETIRKDGLRIISCHLPHKKGVQVELIARVGYAEDPEDKRGLFHTFEHMAFKGTKRRNLKALQTFSRENFFGTNATTQALATTYELGAIDRKLPAACDYLCDIYFNSVFPEAELEKEKGAILLEIARREDNDKIAVWQAMGEHLYKNNPVRLFGGGTRDGVKNVSRKDLLRERAIWHIPFNTVAIALGNVDHKAFVREMNRHVPINFKKVELRTWSDEADELPREKNVIIARPERQKAILAIGRKLAIGVDIKTREATSMFSKLMGNSSNSILWDEIREKRGLAYTIDSSLSGTAGLCRDFSVYAEVDPGKIEEVSKLIWKILNRSILNRKAQFEELRERVYEVFEINAVEQSNIDIYESKIWEKIVEGKSVKSVEQEDRKRLRALASLTIKDLEKIRELLIRPEHFVQVVLRSKD